MRVNARITEVREVDILQADIKHRLERIIRRMYGYPVYGDLSVEEGMLVCWDEEDRGRHVKHTKRILREATPKDHEVICILGEIYKSDWDKL